MRIAGSIRANARARYTATCVHCGSVRQLDAKYLRGRWETHRGCSRKDPHRARMLSRSRDKGVTPPGTDPRWAQWAAELERDPSVARTWPAQRLPEVIAWRDCQRMDQDRLTLDDWASARRDRGATP